MLTPEERKTFQNTGRLVKWDDKTGKKYIITVDNPNWVEVPLAPHERTTIGPGLLERVGKGADDVVSGAQQGLLYLTNKDEFERFTKQKDIDNEYYQKALNERGHQGIDWPRLGGQIGMTSPVGLMPAGTKTGPQMLYGGLQGATSAGIMYTPEGQSKLLQTILGGITGAGGNVAMNKAVTAAAKGVAKARNAFNNVRASIFPDQEIVLKLNRAGVDLDSMSGRLRQSMIDDAREQLKLSGKLDKAALTRKAKAEDLGFTDDYAMTTGQATRDPTLWARERNIAKTEDGLPVLDRFKNQNRRLATELREEMPQSPIVGDDVGESISNSVNRKWREMQEQVSSVYKQIDQDVEGYAIRGMPRFEENLKVMADDATAAPVIESVLNRGRRIGLFGDEVKDVSVKNVEQFRKFINKIGDKNEPSLMRVKKEVIDMLDDEVIDGLEVDAYKFARDKARERFVEFETKLVKNIVDGKTPPDKLFNKVLNSPRNELEALKYSLNKSHIQGEEAIGGDTWNAIRSSALDWLWDQSTQGMRGEGQFSGTMFKKAMDKLGEKKMQILFDDDELLKLLNIRDTGIDLTREPAFSSVNYSNTTPALYNMLSRVPYIGDAFADAAQDQVVNMSVNRALNSSPAVQLTPEEVLSNMRGLLDVHPVMKGLLQGTAGSLRNVAPIMSTGLLPKPSGE